MSSRLVTCLLLAEILIGVKSVETAEDGTSQSLEFQAYIMSMIQTALSTNKGIFPGTKWCGNGNVAKHDMDFGIHEQTDWCCKVHDSCEINIKTGATNYGITNTGKLTVNDCHCDQCFKECLTKVITSTVKSIPESDKKVAKAIGVIFFNLNEQKCLEHVYPTVCVEEGLEGLCNQYVNDTSQPMIWKLVNNLPFLP